MSKVEDYEVQESCGNIFSDLGLPNADELLAKADVAIRIKQLIQERGLTQEQAARMMHTTQASVSKILAERLEGFSLGRLFRCLTALDQDVQIIIRPKPESHKRGKLSVAALPG